MRSLPILLLVGAGLFGASWLATALPASAPGALAPLRAQDPDEEEIWEEELRDPAEIREEIQGLRREQAATLARHAIADFEHQMRTMEARFALENAQADLTAFETYQMRADLAASELEVSAMKDGVQDAEEELQQLEQMYGENELADRTAEIVLRRGRRELETTRLELRLAEEAHRQQVQVVMPREQLAMHQALRSSEMDLRLADLEQDAKNLEQADELLDLEEQIRALTVELAEAEAAAEEK